MQVVKLAVLMQAVCATLGYNRGDLESADCVSAYTCDPNNNSFPDKSCFCDKLCVLRNDCCSNYKPVDDPLLFALASKKINFTCVKGRESSWDNLSEVLMVATCPKTWNEEGMRRDCEMDNETDILSNVPVSNIKTNIMYKNMFCAYCNNEYTFLFWDVDAMCSNKTFVKTNKTKRKDSKVDSPFCYFAFKAPNAMIAPVACHGYVVDSCPAEGLNDTMCRNGPFALVNNLYNSYKNKHCAICNNVPEKDLMCKMTPEITAPTQPTSSFRILINFNSRNASINGVQLDPGNCSNNQIFNPIVRECRTITCPLQTVPKQGKCYLDRKCDFLAFDESELKYTNQSTVILLASKKEVSLDDTIVHNNTTYICVNVDSTPCQHCAIRAKLSFISSIISLIALAIAITIYAVFSQLRNTPGKILLSLMVSLFFAQLLVQIANEAEGKPILCKVIAILTHYGYLAAFCWMNVIALDLWITFSNHFISARTKDNTPQRWYAYNIYSWLVPLLIVVSAVAIDIVSNSESISRFQPRYGQGICWFNSNDGLLLFFLGPLAAFKLFDVIAFIFTAMYIAKAKRQGTRARGNKNTCLCLVNLKLSLVLGLTWLFAFLAKIVNVEAVWYLHIIFNALQGLFICISFVCTKKVLRLVTGAYRELPSLSGTQRTNESNTIRPGASINTVIKELQVKNIITI